MKLIGPFQQLVTLKGLVLKGAIKDDELEVIEYGGILVDDEVIVQVGPWAELKSGDFDELEEITSPMVALPGLIDSHTHICFGGTRERDYAMRIAGKSYLEIAKAGGGIWDTVTHTRAASANDLLEGMLQRISRQILYGITTCEVKSGYGLSVEEELKMLRTIQKAQQSTPIELVATCLAAHTKPRDFPGTNQEYLTLMLSDLLPTVKAESLAQRIDIFTEEGAFTVAESQPYLETAKSMGFDLTIHGDQFSSCGSELGVNVGVRSVDHLEASTEKDILRLAKSDVIGTALPGASLGLGCPFTPARQLLDQGGCLAIASDWNPGSAPMGDLLTQAAILSTMEKLSTAETFAGLTFRAAAALGLTDRGQLTPGKMGDLVAFPTSDYRDILYYQGQMKPVGTWKNGTRIHG
ncbi:MAG: imidazolonepropionase [Cytophagales bacterium]|nr:imidazolonepropionase [Cytophagales bacterium]